MQKHLSLKHGVLTLLLMLGSCVGLYAQQEQRVTLNLKNVSLKEMFRAIEEQSTYRFSYRNNVVDDRADITVSKKKKWVLLVSINPGGPFGGSATQYFVGDFDGKTFTCESRPEQVKWMDYGKDHYATVTWSGVPDGRHIAMAWMSNWQYANEVRSATGLITLSRRGDRRMFPLCPSGERSREPAWTGTGIPCLHGINASGGEEASSAVGGCL